VSTESDRKTSFRTRLRAARRERPRAELDAAGPALARQVLELPEVVAAKTVSLYVSGPLEPPTAELLAALVRRGQRVLLPVVLPDLDLDWAWYDGPEALGRAQDTAMRLLEPTGPRLGRDAIGSVDVVLAPGLAVGADGSRLGQGGGCYDRALTRVGGHVPVVVLLFDDEVVPEVPAEPHDRRVDAAATPARVVQFDSGRPR